jgi:transposase-like protein
MRVAPTVVLSPEERTQLHRWSHRKAGGDFRALRARIVLGAASGLQDLEIGRSLGVSRLTAARWRRRFLSLRLRGIDQHSLPRIASSRIPEDRVRAIVRAAMARDPDLNRPWSTRSLARAMGVSHTTVRRVWESYRVRPVRFEVWPTPPHPPPPRLPVVVQGI